MPVIIKPLLPEQGEEALSFIAPYEFECANLASEILRGCENCWAIYYVDSLQAQKGGNQNCLQAKEWGGQNSSQAQKDGDNCSQAQKGGSQNCSQAQNEGDQNCLQAQKGGASNCHPELLSGGKDPKLAGIFALKKKRSLFHCLPFAKYKSAFDKKVCSEAQKPLADFFEKNEPFCVNGEAVGSVFIRNILKNKKSPMKPSVVNKYFLMVRGEENESCPQALERRISRNVRARDQARANSGIEALSQEGGANRHPELVSGSQAQEGGANRHPELVSGSQAQEGGGLKVFTAGANDFSRLLPLELGYQREEVVPPSFDITDQALSAAFKEIVADGNHYALEVDGQIAAVAKVSSQGRRFAMIGGVYTKPSERNKGRAAFLVSQIMRLKSEKGMPNFCLYAKQTNAAALALYKKLGFVSRGEYLLLYY